ncbi:major facilitator superfamily domain-containing protein [Zychaea mexicana]|uniref:major facilitator superfamily domain-containing protein n=1 Tax=Zychaea mexicana TaxID=64656 RepID=UPI0022FDDE38|nr:major facilitator superfamily domain-containing protein [Zychaea mexicana]KAI9467718.1 major facilitator superfamily domain-containing protein [Zychaea mexicana]
MQDYFLRENVFSGPNVQTQLTMVGSILQMVVAIFMLIVNVLHTFLNFKTLLVSGIVLASSGLILSGFCTSVWQLYFSYSLCTGIGCAILFWASYRILPQWFVKYRSTAFGVQTSMFPLVGLVLPFAMIKINNSLGPSWTFRIMGLVFLTLGILAFPLIKERQPPEQHQKKTDKSKNRLKRITEIIDVSLFKNVNLMIWIAAGPLQVYATYIITTFLPAYATSIGLSDVQGAAVVATLSGTGLIGRLANGFLADKFGNLNTFIVCMVIASLTVYLNWMFAHSFATLVVFAVLNGLVYGCYVVTKPAIIIAIVGMEKYPAAIALQMLTLVVSVFGSLAAGYIESVNHNSSSGKEPYFYCKIIAGSGYVGCCILALILKLRMKQSV